MLNRKHTSKMIAAAATLSLVAAACGSDSEESVATSTPTASDAPIETDAPVETDAPAESSAFGPACSAIPADGEGSLAGMTDDPAATAASNNPLLSTLVAAVGEAGLVDTLNSDGPFTIFAPTNDAFAAIPEADLAAVLADQELLTSILTYHVVAGESLDAAALGEAGMAETVNGGTIEFGADGTTVNGVEVLCSDIVTANATVHVIGEVLMPAAVGDTEEGPAAVAGPTGPLCSAVPVDGEGSFAGMTDDPAGTAASNNPALSTLVAAVVEAELVDTLNSDGPFTIFAPANPAFDALPEGTLESVLADKEMLTSILTLHVVAGEQYSSADLAELDSLTTVNGQDITFAVDGETLMVNGQAAVGCADVMTANATVHIIDGVLLPA
jgi:uncharacterized surface protein with fasciclin (FAS1) repeats